MQSFSCARIAMLLYTLAIIILVGGTGTGRVALAAEPVADRTAKQDLDRLRRYLPVLLRKSLLENDHEQVRSIEEFVKLSKALKEAGDISQAQADALERQLIRMRIRVLERQTDYQNALDEFNLRFPGGEKRQDRFAKVTFLLLRQQLEQFRKLPHDRQAFEMALGASNPAEKAPKLRADWRGLVASAGLFQGTKFRDQLPLQWASWETLAAKDLSVRLDKLREEQRKLLDKMSDLETKGQPPDAAGRKRLVSVECEMNLGEFERNLREYEGQSWKQVPQADQRHRLQQKSFRGVMNGFILVVRPAHDERISRLQNGWPKLPGMVIDQTDLLSINRDKAEQALTARLKTAEARLAIKKKFREVRLLAEVYPLRQRVFELSYGELGGARDRAFLPPGAFPKQDTWGIIQAAIRADHAMLTAVGEIYRTWFNYHSARLDLYHDLDITPP